MWPFSDNKPECEKPEWEKARDERERMIQKFIIENAPNIMKMRAGYFFGSDIPAKLKCRPMSGMDEYNGGCVIEYVKYKLTVERYGSGPMIGIRTITKSPRIVLPDGLDFDRPVIISEFQNLYMESQLENWKVELAQQLPDFFEQLNADINYRMRLGDCGNNVEKMQRKRSVDNTRDILECLKSKLNGGRKV